MSMAMPEDELCLVAAGCRGGEYFSMVWRQ
ncbi:hypothetical protein L483_12060 [Pseudomonas putida H8234]|nr:hypothetical protein L483_12060 [Pseudomonas putida H8234]